MSAKVTGLHISSGGVPKTPVHSLSVSTNGCQGDDQDDKKHHGGKNKAICLFQQEILDSLSSNGHPIYPGSTGENILIEGIEIGSIEVGTCLKIGEIEITVTQDAPPCKTISNSFIDGEFTKISHRKNTNFTRWYAAVKSTGNVNIGDKVELIN
ncbi:MAG: MOSC domain-containing protein [Candidatus Poseidoniaceae archaeon]|nr:MOSC domain-containing protein [Candidatus Poseidoniaceae archaeon]MBL6895714.1 MOSC domain-containing protein [Candidatus Poseidoniaceae archaeon]